jgi:excisionase family DNA binding protein
VNERLLRAGEVAEALDVSPETVLRWTRRGELPAASPDRRTRPPTEAAASKGMHDKT